MRTERKYWKGLEELHETPAFKESVENEFPKDLSVDEFLSDDKLKESSTGRRDFLKFLGFSVAAAAVFVVGAALFHVENGPFVFGAALGHFELEARGKPSTRLPRGGLVEQGKRKKILQCCFQPGILSG